MVTSSIGGGLTQGMPFGGSIHSDILSARPSTSQEKLSLVEELKRRGRASVASKSYQDAEALYSKAIETLSDDNEIHTSYKVDIAILNANRSMARFQMGKLDSGLADAERAIELDPAYVKGYWRAGQCLSALKRYDEALKMYERAKNWDPKNKAIGRELEKLRSKLEKERLLMETTQTTNTETESSSRPVSAPSASRAKVKTSKSVKSQPNSTALPSKKATSTFEDGDDDDDIEFTKSDAVRGYKVVGGKKTSYFHREQTEEEKKLIGDIAPKKLDGAIASAAADVNEEKKDVSAWNKAGTWEEKDVTSWAKETLKAAVLSTTYVLPEGTGAEGAIVSITDVKDLDGHASVATVRGKRRYIFEFSFKIRWELPLKGGEETAAGTMTFPDVDGTCDGDYDMTGYSVGPETPPNAKHLLDRFVRNSGLRDEITKALNGWVDLFQATYSL